MAIFNSYVKLPEGKKNADRNRPELGKKPRCRGVGGTKAGERGKATAGGPCWKRFLLWPCRKDFDWKAVTLDNLD